MTSIAIPVSEMLVVALNQSVAEIANAMRQQYAMTMFQEGKLTLNQAAEFCGENMYDFMGLLAQAGIPIIDYEGDDFDRELANLEAYKA